MKKATIEIRAKFGSKFQEQFARDSLFATLKAWRQFLENNHNKNDVLVVINGDNIKRMDWFVWHTVIKGRKES